MTAARVLLAYRYNGTGDNTTDPATPRSHLSRTGRFNRFLNGILQRPDTLKRRHQSFTSYQHNRNPFNDHPECWSIFVKMDRVIPP